VFRVLDVALRLESDDPLFVQEFAALFGRPEPEPGSPLRATLSASLRLPDGAAPATGTLDVEGDDLDDPAAFLLGFSSPTVPIRAAPSDEPGWEALALATDPQPALWFQGRRCRFRAIARWRRVLSHFLFLRLLRLRSDALFFHAASLAVAGRGVLLVGPKGSGKTTIALALATRGHGFLGDETACYLPPGQLAPLWRPVGIKPGPQAAAVRAALGRRQPPADEDGLVRIELTALLDVPRPGPVALGAVVFLQGFAASPAMTRIEPGREELSQLQPLAISLTQGPATRRVFEMVRMLAAVRAYRLLAGDPDETAILVERELGASA
jgi:hypothetical protein